MSLLRSTVPSSVSAAIQQADHVMVFTGDLGKYGGTANLMQLEKVRLIKQINPDGFLIKSDMTSSELAEAFQHILSSPPYYSSTVSNFLKKSVNFYFKLC